MRRNNVAPARWGSSGQNARPEAIFPSQAGQESLSLVLFCQFQPFLLGRGQCVLALGQAFAGLGELGRGGLEQVGLGQEFGQLADLGLQPLDDGGQRLQALSFAEAQAGALCLGLGAGLAGEDAIGFGTSGAGDASGRCAR